MLYSLLTIHAHGHSSVIRLATKKSMLSVVAVIVVIIIDIPRTTKYTYSRYVGSTIGIIASISVSSDANISVIANSCVIIANISIRAGIIAITTYTIISICIITIVIVTIVVSLTDLINTIIMICMSLHTITVILLIILVIVNSIIATRSHLCTRATLPSLPTTLCTQRRCRELPQVPAMLHSLLLALTKRNDVLEMV